MVIRKIGAIAVLYNPTRREIENIYAYCIYIDELVLIDNSEISNEIMISNAFGNDINSRVKYLFCNENIGLCAGLNRGIEIARREGCDWCYLMDQDSKFGNNLTEIFRKIILTENDSQIAILGPQHLYDRRKLKKCEGVYDVEWLMTSGCLVNASIFHQVGGFDERLFLDGLDVEFCLRLRKQGYRVLECREAVLVHRPAVTKTKKILWYTLKYGWDKPVRYYYQARADVFIDKRYKTCYAD